MKAQFETPEVKILEFLPEDIITISSGGAGSGDDINWDDLV